MTPRQFCYWLQGFFEINGDAPALTAEQSKMVREHLQLVFEKRTGTKAAPSTLDNLARGMARSRTITTTIC